MKKNRLPLATCAWTRITESPQCDWTLVPIVPQERDFCRINLC